MGEIKVKLSDEVERAFRQNAMREFGYGKGSLSEAAEKALKAWSKERDIPEHPFVPVRELLGMLKHVKKSSVQLQHEVGAIRSRRHAY